jgi:hypothetical protein
MIRPEQALCGSSPMTAWVLTTSSTASRAFVDIVLERGELRPAG